MVNWTHKLYAPPCCIPNCQQLAGYHEKYNKVDGTIGYKWKNYCEYHRRDPMGKLEKEKFMLSKGGCENRNGILGWTCGDPNTSSLTIDHIDGNKHHNDASNLMILCANCHNKKTKINKDHLVRYYNVNGHFSNVFEIL